MVKVILGGWDLRIIKGGYAEESTLDIMMEKPPGILVRTMRTFDCIPVAWTRTREKNSWFIKPAWQNLDSKQT